MKELMPVRIKDKFLLTFFMIAFLLADLSAQDFYIALTYSVAKPTGNTEDFIGRTSVTGLGLDIRKLIDPNVSVGFFSGWNAFSDEIQSQGVDSLSMLINQEKLMNSFPLFVTSHYYFSDDREFIPFIGLGIGIIYIFQSVKDNISTSESNNWHFGFAPEAGFVYLLGSVYAFIGMKYYYAAPVSNEIFNESLSQSYFAFNIGIAFVPLGNF